MTSKLEINSSPMFLKDWGVLIQERLIRYGKMGKEIFHKETIGVDLKR